LEEKDCMIVKWAQEDVKTLDNLLNNNNNNNNFDKELYMFLTDLRFIIRNLNTVYTAIGICHASYVDCLLADSQHN